MRLRLQLLILTPLIVCAPAQGEFLVLSTSDGSATRGSDTPAHHPKAKSRVPKAHISVSETPISGFGKQVPLTFAVRQIVPANFQVAYADGVRRDVPVDWKGGEPWRATLARAVRPSGLAVTINGSKVTIAPAH